tara:strand:+ start:549 stop:932 length:384 start_codon:yes stop_codon:yes gene_type:complete
MSGLVGQVDSRSKLVGLNKTVKAFAVFDQKTSTTHTIGGSFNVSTIGDEAQGKSLVNFLSPMRNANYTVTTNHAEDNGSYGNYGDGSRVSAHRDPARTTSAFYVACTVDNSGGFADMETVDVIVCGD